MIAGKGTPRPVGAVHAGRQAHEHDSCSWIAERGHRTAVIVGFLGVNGIQKCRETRAAPAIGVKNRIHGREGLDNAGRKEKTGYADHRVARHRSRLSFGLTRAQLNPSPVGLEPVRPLSQGKNSTQLANYFCWLSLALSSHLALKCRAAG